jgi:hypothetical protein
MAFVDYIKDGIELIKLNTSVADKLAKDKAAFGMGVLFFAIAGVASAIGMLNFIGIVVMPILEVVGSFIGVGILHLLAMIFGGKAKFGQYYGVLGIGALISWISVIPIIGVFLSMLAGLWMIVMAIVITKTVHQLSTGKAAAVVLIPVAIVMIISFVLAAMFVALLAAAGMGGLMGSIPQ